MPSMLSLSLEHFVLKPKQFLTCILVDLFLTKALVIPVWLLNPEFCRLDLQLISLKIKLWKKREHHHIKGGPSDLGTKI